MCHVHLGIAALHGSGQVIHGILVLLLMSSKPLLFQTLKIKSNHKHMQVAPCVIHNQSINQSINAWSTTWSWCFSESAVMSARSSELNLSTSRFSSRSLWRSASSCNISAVWALRRRLSTSAFTDICHHTHTHTHGHTHIHGHTHTGTHTSMLTALHLPLIKRWLAVSAGWSTSIMFTVTYLCHLPVHARTCHSSLQWKTGLQILWI